MSGLGKEGSVAGVILKLAWAFFFFFPISAFTVGHSFRSRYFLIWDP